MKKVIGVIKTALLMWSTWQSDDVGGGDLRQKMAGCVHISAIRFITSDWLAARKKRTIGQEHWEALNINSLNLHSGHIKEVFRVIHCIA